MMQHNIEKEINDLIEQYGEEPVGKAVERLFSDPEPEPEPEYLDAA
jgi:uncharacterized protein YbcI